MRCGGATGLPEILSWEVGGGGAEHLIVGTFSSLGDWGLALHPSSSRGVNPSLPSRITEPSL